MPWGTRTRKRIITEQIEASEPNRSELPEALPDIQTMDGRTGQYYEDSQIQRLTEDAYNTGAIEARREERVKQAAKADEDYARGYVDAYQIVQHCVIAYENDAPRYIMKYLSVGATASEVREAVAQDRAESSRATAIRSQIMPDTGTQTKPLAKEITTQDRNDYADNFNHRRKLPL